MGQIVPDLVERYLGGLNHLAEPLLLELARVGDEQDLPAHRCRSRGAPCAMLATAIGARRILEIGTAIGYSGIWLAGALPAGGQLLTMEMDEERVRRGPGEFQARRRRQPRPA